MRVRVMGWTLGSLSLLLATSAFADPPPLKVIKLEPRKAAAEIKTTGLEPEIERLLIRIADNRTGGMSDKQDFSTLLDMGDRAVPVLGQVLKDADAPFNQRWIASRALGRIGGTEARTYLHDTLKDDRFSMARLAAIRSLKDLGDRSVVPTLVESLDDEAMVVRSAAADALAHLGDHSIAPALLDALDQEENFYRGRSLWVRQHIVAALGALQYRGAVPRLVELLDDADPRVHVQAVRSLESITRQRFPARAESSHDYAQAVTPKWKKWWEKNKSEYL